MKNKLMNKIRTAGRRLLAGLAGFGMLTAGLAPAVAANPSFSTASPILQTAKAGAAAWDPAGTATVTNVGDAVELTVWIHNQTPNTVAKNVNVKVPLGTATTTSHTITAQITADNASASGQRMITSNRASQLMLVPSSTRLQIKSGNSMVNTAWPSTWNKDAITTTGINIGDLAGSEDYSTAKALVFQAVVTEGAPAVKAYKQVELDNGQGVYGTAATASPGDVVNYRVVVENNGSGTGYDTKIEDTLDSRLSYIPGSGLISGKRDNQDYEEQFPESKVAKDGQKLTFSVGDIASRPEATIALEFQAKVAGDTAFTSESTTIENRATVRMSSSVSATTGAVTVTVKKLAPNTVTFSVRKEVKNYTLDPNSLYKNERLSTAGPGDELQYRVTVLNTGNVAAENVIVKDILPSGMTFMNNLKQYDKDGKFVRDISGDAIVKGGLNLGTVQNGNANAIQLVFTAKLSGTCSQNYISTNKAQIIYGGAVKVEDTAEAAVSCQRGLTVTKDVLDPKDNVYKDEIGMVDYDTVLTYRINVFNNSTTTYKAPKLSDVLPQMVEYVPGSLSIDGVPLSQVNVDQFFGGGMILTDFSPGMSKIIVFKVKALCPPQDFKIVNTARLVAEGVNVTDTATATISYASCHIVTTVTGKPPVAQKPVKPVAPALPETGPEAVAMLFTGLAGSGAYAGRYLAMKRKLHEAARNIDVI